ncbi:MAG TPA: FAD-dependent monooxygenase [Verrucomicrobiae bacterium]|nr:FAD-dependent monooxygenase [Verrucomicrobiae bacterium]
MRVHDGDGVDVLVVGAGPVGLAAACELTRRGVRCRVIDRNSGPTPPGESRALVLWERTLEVLDQLGVAGRVLCRGKEVRALNLYGEGGRIARLPVDLLDPDCRYRFPITIPQGETERILEERLREMGGCVERRTRLIALEEDSEGVTVTVLREGRTLEEQRVTWVVGCDGAGSTVRSLLSLDFEGEEYSERFSLADVRMDSALPADEATVWLQTGGGGVGAIPLPEEGCWRLIDATGHAPPDTPELLLARFDSLMRGEGLPAVDIREALWTSTFRIHRRIAGTFRMGRCFLAGDAAHIHSPVGGQGMNTGIQDAANLGWKLALAVAGRCGSFLLDSYDAERRPVARAVLRGTHLATRTLMLHARLAERLRNRMVALLGGRRGVQRRLRRRLSELNVSYRRSPLTSGMRTGRRGLGAGDRLPDALLRVDPAGADRLYDRLGERLQLLLFTGPTPSAEEIGALQHTAASVSGRWGEVVEITFVQHPRGGAFPRDADGTILDLHGVLHRRFASEVPTLLLVRPDRYIAYFAHAVESAAVEACLQRMLG